MESDRTAADVFRLLADDTRLDVLEAVAVAQRDERRTGVTSLSFSDIYDRVDVDNTSKLSYHLGELTGTFLRKHDDGYAFTHAGEQLVRFVLAENYREPGDVGAVETDGCCLYCGEATLVASLHDQYFVVRCSACDRPVFSYRIRPAHARSRSGDAMLRAVAREHAGDFLKMRRGVCPDCAGRLDTEVVAADTGPDRADVPTAYATVSECRECLRCLSLPLPYAAAYHPAAVAFHWAHGVNVLDTGFWEFHRYLHDDRWTAARVDTEPREYRVTMRYDADVLRVFLDADAAVTRTERVQRTAERARRD